MIGYVLKDLCLHVSSHAIAILLDVFVHAEIDVVIESVFTSILKREWEMVIVSTSVALVYDLLLKLYRRVSKRIQELVEKRLEMVKLFSIF